MRDMNYAHVDFSIVDVAHYLRSMGYPGVHRRGLGNIPCRSLFKRGKSETQRGHRNHKFWSHTRTVAKSPETTLELVHFTNNTTSGIKQLGTKLRRIHPLAASLENGKTHSLFNLRKGLRKSSLGSRKLTSRLGKRPGLCDFKNIAKLLNGNFH